MEYYQNPESVKEYIHLAKDVSGKELIAILKKYLAVGSKLLEIGSGPGTDWNILKQDYVVTGSDNSQEFLKHLKNNNPNGTFIELDAVTLDTPEKFDGIYSNKVLHHLTTVDLKNSIDRQFDTLKNEGIICHTFWNGEGDEIFKGMYVNYHNEQSLRELFEPKFEVLLSEQYKEFEEDDSIFLVAKKNTQ